MEERRTSFTASGLILPGDGAGQALDLLAAAMHYWRVPRRDWRACLQGIRDLGFAIVESYVPWGVHETAADQYDWSGDLDLGAFIDTAGELGLKVILRPGPHINAELTLFGFPERVLRDGRMLARTARDTPAWLPVPPRMFPVPSYASRAFQREVRHWYDAVGEVVEPRLHPRGPVVALQIDNEMQMFFRTGAFDLDYHPDALAWWQEHAPELGDAPRAWAPADAARCVEWVRFKDRYTQRSLAWLARAAEAAGLGEVARYHNLPPGEAFHLDLPGAARAVGGPCGLDFYHTAADYPVVRRRALHLVGSGEPLPLAPEVGVGGPPWLPPMTEADQHSVTLGLLAAGVRALSFFMVVDRERWYGAALDMRGQRRPPAAWLERLLATLAEVQWTRLRRRVPVALVLARADARFATASSRVDPMSPVVAEFLRLGPAGAAELGADPGAIEQRRWFAAIEEALARGGVAYEIVDEECGVDRLRRYQAVVVPTVDRVDRGLWKRLHEAAAAGVRVVLGPGRPALDELGAPLDDASLPRRAGLIRPESRDDLDGLAADLAAIAGEPPADATAGPAGSVDASLFADAGGRARVLLLGNRTGAAVEAEVDVPGTLRDPFGGPDRPVLAPHQVRMFILD